MNVNSLPKFLVFAAMLEGQLCLSLDFRAINQPLCSAIFLGAFGTYVRNSLPPLDTFVRRHIGPDGQGL